MCARVCEREREREEGECVCVMMLAVYMVPKATE